MVKERARRSSTNTGVRSLFKQKGKPVYGDKDFNPRIKEYRITHKVKDTEGVTRYLRVLINDEYYYDISTKQLDGLYAKLEPYLGVERIVVLRGDTLIERNTAYTGGGVTTLEADLGIEIPNSEHNPVVRRLIDKLNHVAERPLLVEKEFKRYMDTSFADFMLGKIDEFIYDRMSRLLREEVEKGNLPQSMQIQVSPTRKHYRISGVGSLVELYIKSNGTDERTIYLKHKGVLKVYGLRRGITQGDADLERGLEKTQGVVDYIKEVYNQQGS